MIDLNKPIEYETIDGLVSLKVLVKELKGRSDCFVGLYELDNLEFSSEFSLNSPSLRNVKEKITFYVNVLKGLNGNPYMVAFNNEDLAKSFPLSNSIVRARKVEIEI